MNIDDCLLIREEVIKFIEKGYDSQLPIESSHFKQTKALLKLSIDIFNKMYKGKDARANQALLYQEDINFLVFNIKDFEEKYFLIQLDGWRREDLVKSVLEKILKSKQYGHYLLITREKAEEFLKIAKLNSFKKA